MDQTDLEKGRIPLRVRDLAEAINEGPALVSALEELDQGAARRAQEAHRQLAEKVEANRAAGLDPRRPPVEEDVIVTTPLEGDETRSPGNLPDPPTPPPAEGVPDPDPRQEGDRIDTVLSRATARVAERHEAAQRRALQALPRILRAGSRERTLEESAEILIAELQPGEQDSIRNVMQDDQLPNWAILLGAVRRIVAINELNAGDFDPDWLSRDPRQPTAGRARAEICQTCGGEMPPHPVLRNRVACCNKHGSGFIDHTEGCALAHRQMRAGQWVTVGQPA